MKTVLGFVVAFAIGVVCRLTDVPLPAPLALLGALLVAAMTAGYVVADRLLASRAEARRSSGGNAGEAAAPQDRAP